MGAEWLAFTVGVILGGVCGISIMALCAIARQSDE